MTKEKISSMTKEKISSMNCNSDKVFAISIKNCGYIYCNGIRIDNTDLLNFYNNGKIIAILDYSAIEKIDLL